MEIVSLVVISLVSSAIGAFVWTKWKERSGRIELVLSNLKAFGTEFDGLSNDIHDLGLSVKCISSDFDKFSAEMEEYMKESAKAIRDLRYELSELRGGIFGGQTAEDLPPVSMENMEDSFEFDVKSLMEQGFDRSYAEKQAAETILNKLAQFGVGEGLGMVNNAESN